MISWVSVPSLTTYTGTICSHLPRQKKHDVHLFKKDEVLYKLETGLLHNKIWLNTHVGCLESSSAHHSSRAVWGMNSSSLALTLGSWVRIPLKTWMFGVCLLCVCGMITRPRSPTICDKMITEVNKKLRAWMGWKSHWKKKDSRLKECLHNPDEDGEPSEFLTILLVFKS
jgi:hypothetical protein